jgi:hypothetical protein
MGADSTKVDTVTVTVVTTDAVKALQVTANTAKVASVAAGAIKTASDSLISVADTAQVALLNDSAASNVSIKIPVRCPLAGTPDDVAAVVEKVRAQPDVDLALQQALLIMDGKCFATDQLKQIAKTRLSENWRYRFLEKAYGYAAIQDEFASLADLFSDPYYLGKFKSIMPAAK